MTERQNTNGSVTPLKLANPAANTDCLELLQEAVNRVLTGDTAAVAVVEARRGGQVTYAWTSTSDCYHQLNSGAARMAARLASVKGD